MIRMIGNLTDVTVEKMINQISSLTTFIQAIGGLIILYLIFNIINAILNGKKKKQLERINENLEEIKQLLKNKRKKGK